MVNIGYWFDRFWKYLGVKCLGIFMKDYLEYVSFWLCLWGVILSVLIKGGRKGYLGGSIIIFFGVLDGVWRRK